MARIECVPNFSEGRDLARVEALVATMSAVPGVAVLDRHLDPDHHRSVITCVGQPRAVLEAAFRAVALAVDTIDLRGHDGVHPRIGAADVVPLIPLDGIDLPGCVELARELGERLARELDLPIYLYGAAAEPSPTGGRSDRSRLPWLRQPGFEGLAAALATPERAPDFGPARPHPSAGATVVGARPLLVAFNVELDPATPLAQAQAIARAVRESSGGLPGVQAKGLALTRQGRVQVSMNLTDPGRTGPGAAWQAVCREAAQRGVAVRGSELVGLLPRAALEEATSTLLGLVPPLGGRVLEERLEAAALLPDPDQVGASRVGAPLLDPGSPLERWTAAISSPAPLAPGGGSAVGLALALGRACLAKAARLSAGREGFQLDEALAALTGPRDPADLAGLAVEDHLAWAGLVAARQRPKADPGRAAAVEAARAAAVAAPERTLSLAVVLADAAAGVAEAGNPHLRADAAAAAELALAAGRVARLNARANLPRGGDAALTAALDATLGRLEAAVDRVRRACEA